MAGLSFTDDVDVTPDTPLLPTFYAWVADLAGSKSPATVRGYLFDVALIAGLILENQGRSSVIADGDGLTVPRVPAGVSAAAVSRAATLVGRMTLGDLHPEYLAAAFADFGAAAPGRRRVGDAQAPEHRRASTRRRAAAAWTMLCEYATVRGLLASNPMRDPRINRGGRPAHNPTPFELSEARRLLETLATADVARTTRRPWPQRDLALASVLLTTGIRLSEACSVTVGDLRDVENAPRMHVLGKGTKHRTVPLSGPTMAVVTDYLTDRSLAVGKIAQSDRLFVHPDGRPFTPRSMQHLVYRWYERAGIVPRGESCVHALRHTFATEAVNSSASIVELQELLGHESLETTKRYLKSVGHGLRDAIEAHPGSRLVEAAAHPTATPPAQGA